MITYIRSSLQQESLADRNEFVKERQLSQDFAQVTMQGTRDILPGIGWETLPAA